SAALTGLAPATASSTAATTSSSARPRDPRDGSFTSTRSTPPATASRASAAEFTLTSNSDITDPLLVGRALSAQRRRHPPPASQRLHPSFRRPRAVSLRPRGDRQLEVQVHLEDAEEPRHATKRQRVQVREAEAEQAPRLEPGRVVEVQ